MGYNNWASGSFLLSGFTSPQEENNAWNGKMVVVSTTFVTLSPALRLRLPFGPAKRKSP